jgi:hypothetical protein
MNDKDRQELNVLKVRLQQLQIETHQLDHELIRLRTHVAKRDQHLSILLSMLGLLPDDLDALTSTATLLLRLSRPEN